MSSNDSSWESPPALTARQIRAGIPVAAIALGLALFLWAVRPSAQLEALVLYLASSLARPLWILRRRGWANSTSGRATLDDEVGRIRLRRGQRVREWAVGEDGRLARQDQRRSAPGQGVTKRGCVLLLQVYSWWDVAFGLASVVFLVGVVVAWSCAPLFAGVFVIWGTFAMLPIVAFAMLVHSLQSFLRVRDVALDELGGSFDPTGGRETFRFEELTQVSRLGPLVSVRTKGQRCLVASLPWASWGHADILEAVIKSADPRWGRSRSALTSSWFGRTGREENTKLLRATP